MKADSLRYSVLVIRAWSSIRNAEPPNLWSCPIKDSWILLRGFPSGRIWLMAIPRPMAPTPPRKPIRSTSNVRTPIRRAPNAAPKPAGPPPATSTSTSSCCSFLLPVFTICASPFGFPLSGQLITRFSILQSIATLRNKI
ncbi:hypothetical protein ES708_31203 [subsurface metagenome]